MRATQERAPTGRIRLFRLTHVIVVLTNVLQLLFMITFLVLLLLQLNEDIAVSWLAVFMPLWMSDAITTITGIQEMRRLCAPGESRRLNPIISQVNRFKGCLCVAIFKLLLALRLNGVLPNLPIRVVCLPYYFAAILRCVLHFAKEPIRPPEGSAHRTARPGTPVNPVHLMIVVLACRVDGLHPFGHTWAATFWPMWLLFGCLVLASLGAGCLAVGILVTREPRERGQRALFFLCYGILLTITVAGMTFLLNLARLLDGDRSVSYDAIIGPLIGGYSTLLAFYMAFTLVLPRLMLHDVTAAASGDAEEEEEGGVLDLVSQQLAPPFLVQQSSTLFRRMNTGTMWERYIVGAAPEQQAPAQTELAISDLEAPDVACVAPGGEGGTPAPTVAPSDGAAPPAIAAPPAAVLSEYDALQLEIEAWVRAQQRPAQPQPKPRRGKASVQAAGLGVPSEIKSKLQRFVALKQLLAAAACAEGVNCGACCASTPPQHSAVNTPSPAASPAPPPAPPADAEPRKGVLTADAELHRGVLTADAEGRRGVLTADAEARSAAEPPQSRTEQSRTEQSRTEQRTERSGLQGGINAAISDAIRAAACGAADAVLPTLGDALAAGEERADASDTLCWICFEGQRDAVLLECGHGGICFACAQRCFKKKGRICPMCRQPVTQVVHIELDAAGAAEPERNRGGVVRIRQVDLPAELQ